MLPSNELRAYYEKIPLKLSRMWNLSHKQVKLRLWNEKYVKVNKFRNHISPRDLRYFCVKYGPDHVYFSVMNWLFPERVGKKHKANKAYPLGGEYVVDVDSHLAQPWWLARLP